MIYINILYKYIHNMYIYVIVKALLYSVYCHRRQQQPKYYRSFKYKYKYIKRCAC